MQRGVSAFLLLAGAALLLTWVVTPASSSPKTKGRAADSAVDQVTPWSADINAQVEKLGQRLAAPSDFLRPTRDPFTFGRRSDSSTATTAPAPAVDIAPPPPARPRLVAILTASDTDSARTAVFADGDDVRFVRSGETMGDFAIGSVGRDTVTLTDRTSGASFELALH